jgi:uncharacterized membrane protein
MRGDDAIAFILTLITLSVAVLIFYSLFLRYRKRDLQHKERLAALEKGMPLPELHEARSSWSPRVYLLRGMMWLFGGIAIVVFLAAVTGSSPRHRSLENRLDRAENLNRLGATDEQIKQAESEPEENNGPPPAISLLGLIPIGVGLAYLIFYRSESKQIEVRRHES